MLIFLELFLTFFKIGAFTFGGGYAMLPLIQEEVLKKEWLTNADMMNFIAVSESTPGPFAINIATYVGSEVGGNGSNIFYSVLGSFCATLGVVLPSFIVILIIARMYQKFKSSRVVMGAMSGLRPAAIGLIGSAIVSSAITVFAPAAKNIYDVFSHSINPVALGSSVVIFALSLFLALKKKHPILIIVLSAVLGIAVGYIFKI